MARGMPDFEHHPASYLGSQLAAVVRGRGVHVVDGDTYDLLLDLGFFQYALATVRLLDADTPELNSDDPSERARAAEARDRAAELLLGRHVLVRSYKDRQTFGRFVAEVWVTEESADGAGLPAADLLAIKDCETQWIPMNKLLAHEGLTVQPPG